MRPIKFRAWDKARAKMSPVCNMSFGHDGSALTIIFQTAPQEKYYRGLVNGENGILMQFTGLLDKNGREIYEGDILGVVDPGDKSKAVIVFRDAAFKAELVGYPKISSSNWTQDDDWVIIGNIYEHPELMEVKHEQ